MYEGRERCRELIEEFRSTCVLQKHDRKVLEKEKKDILSLQYEQHSKIKQENRLSEILNSLEGMTVSRMLDYLSKVRFKISFSIFNPVYYFHIFHYSLMFKLLVTRLLLFIFYIRSYRGFKANVRLMLLHYLLRGKGLEERLLKLEEDS